MYLVYVSLDPLVIVFEKKSSLLHFDVPSPGTLKSDLSLILLTPKVKIIRTVVEEKKIEETGKKSKNRNILRKNREKLRKYI